MKRLLGSRGMTLEDLRTFLIAHRAGSLSEAARQLGCTQAAVAQHVRRLEKELGTELFWRLRRGVAPTASGTTLYEAVSAALVNIDAAVEEIGRSSVRQQEQLRLAVSTVIATRYLRRAILALRERRPHVEVTVEPEDTAEGRLNALREGRADLAMLPLADPVRSLETRPFKLQELGLLVHVDHPLAARSLLHLRDLATIEYIAQSDRSSTYRHIERALADVGIALRPSRIVQDATTAGLMVELGRGQTFAPITPDVTVERSENVRLLPVTSLPPLPLVWAARSFSLLPAVAHDFIAICTELTQSRTTDRAGVRERRQPRTG
jgi:DNA-binding transcriptional LysR family regulator